jgi:lipopolysaccharide/colanic/teichoic acid biosynthesis glycosyltransferase
MKRALDVVLACVALVLLSPLLALAALAVVADSGRPVLFRQRRIGLGGREFGMYKFRTMVVDAAARGPHFTSDGDPRITPSGRFLRRTSIDELPQLVNVLRGEMSLVGPRPHVPVERSLYDEQQWALRCSVRPGITGLAQATLRSSGTLEQTIEADLRYVRQSSVWFDLKIMVWTLRMLRSGKSN